MTITNRKSAPVQFDKNRHYSPASKPLAGIGWKYIEKPEGSGNMVKITWPIDVLACPVQVSSTLFVARLRSDPNTAEWVTCSPEGESQN